MDCIYQRRGLYDYQFNREGNIIDCPCDHCRRWRFILSDGREYENEIDGPVGILDEKREFEREDEERAKRESQTGEGEELRRILRKIGVR